MGRAAIALGTTNGRPGILDRSGRTVFQEGGSTGAPPHRTPRAGSVLSQPAERPQQTAPCQEVFAPSDVGLHEIWFQLALPDRQRFGHRFSGMVLKALGLRSSSLQEDET